MRACNSALQQEPHCERSSEQRRPALENPVHRTFRHPRGGLRSVQDVAQKENGDHHHPKQSPEADRRKPSGWPGRHTALLRTTLTPSEDPCKFGQFETRCPKYYTCSSSRLIS